MGYESRIIVIHKLADYLGFNDDEPRYAETMAIYNMCKFPPFQSIFNSDCPATKYAPYGQEDGDFMIIEDKYGDPLRERTLKEVIDCLDEYIALNPDGKIYPRVKPLKAMLEEFVKIQNDYYQLAVLHYGY
jgi:hypothetical protein